MRVAGYNVKAHRVSWILHCGTIPKGMLVCHTCNNKKCVNPDHLYLGTNLDNVLDAMVDGLRPSGETMVNSKLTDSEVRLMRESRIQYGVSYGTLANMFGVSKSTVVCVLKHKTWKHV